MSEQTLKELQEELVELGMEEEEASEFRTKAAAEVTIKMLKKQPAEKAPEEEKVKSIEERPDPKEEKVVNKSWKSKANRMKAKLLDQEFVSILIPLDPNESMGEVEWVMQDTEENIPLKEWLSLSHAVKMKTYQKHIGGAITSPQLNGFKFMIPKGVYYRVPMQIFEVVNEANMEQLKATQYKNLDRKDPRTGRPVKESF